jgi:hypothetical protein
VPLFVKEGELRHCEHAVIPDELCDDLRDSWAHSSHADEQKKLLDLLAERFEQCTDDRLLVLSGDIHESALLKLTLKNRHAGYEVITSGVAEDVHGKSLNILDSTQLSWRGLAPYGSRRWKAAWNGSIRGAPSFAEILVDASGKKTVDVGVVWYPTANPIVREGRRRHRRQLSNTRLVCGDSDGDEIDTSPRVVDVRPRSCQLEKVRSRSRSSRATSRRQTKITICTSRPSVGSLGSLPICSCTQLDDEDHRVAGRRTSNL